MKNPGARWLSPQISHHPLPTYLGGVISDDATVSKDLDNRLSKASSSFGRLSKRIWPSRLLRFSTEIQGHRAVLYGAQTLVLYLKQIRPQKRFHQRCLRFILGIKWQDHVSNEEVLKKASLPSIECIFVRAGLATSQGRKAVASLMDADFFTPTFPH